MKAGYNEGAWLCIHIQLSVERFQVLIAIFLRIQSLTDMWPCFDDWLTVHRSITLVNFQLDAQNSYLFTCDTFIKILYMFRALPCSSSGDLIISMQYLISSLSAGDCLVHRLRKSSFLTGEQDSHLQRVTIPEAAYIQLRRRPPEDEQGNARNM
jgi:hypothetical protein